MKIFRTDEVISVSFISSTYKNILYSKIYAAKSRFHYQSGFLPSELTFGAAKSHDQWAVALVELPETGTASSVSND